jgi:hypothetical protein
VSSSSAAAAAAAAEHNQRAAQSPAVTLLLLPCVLECLIVEQLSSSEAKPAACRLLMGLLQQGGSSAQQLLPWRPWISSCTGDTAGDALDAALSGILSQGLGQSERALGQEQDQQGFWAGGMVVLLQDLFSVSGEVRRRAGRQLLQVMTAGADMNAEELEEYTGEPSLLNDCYAQGCKRVSYPWLWYESCCSNRDAQQARELHFCWSTWLVASILFAGHLRDCPQLSQLLVCILVALVAERCRRSVQRPAQQHTRSRQQPPCVSAQQWWWRRQRSLLAAARPPHRCISQHGSNILPPGCDKPFGSPGKQGM